MILNIAKTYYSNNPHFKYILYMYGLMVKRFDLDFAKLEVYIQLILFAIYFNKSIFYNLQ
jgi:hypothetical protein